MRRLVLLPAAKADLLTIHFYITRQSGSEAVARRFVERLRARCREIAVLPGELGRPRSELGTGIRSIAMGNYVIFFRYANKRLEVINVIEGHRDLDALFEIH